MKFEFETDIHSPLEQWTLEEAKRYCEKTACVKCILKSFCDNLQLGKITPEKWVLALMPNFTEQEEEVMKYIITSYGGDVADYIERNQDTTLVLHTKGSNIMLPAKMFPSIVPGQRVIFSDLEDE